MEVIRTDFDVFEVEPYKEGFAIYHQGNLVAYATDHQDVMRYIEQKTNTLLA